MRDAHDSRTVRALRRLSGWVYDYRRLFAFPHVVLFFLAILYTVRNLEFKTNRNALVGAEKLYHQQYEWYKREFQAQDELVALVESESLEKNRQFVERLGARLLSETNLFTDVIFNNDVKMLGNKALLFFPEAKLETFRQTLHEYRGVIEKFTQATNLQSLFQLVNRQFRSAPREANAETESLTQALPALERIITQAIDSLGRPGVPPSPGLTALFEAGEEAQRQIYVTFAHGRIYLVTARAKAAALNPAAVQRLRELVNQTRIEVPGVNAAITGEPVLEYDEMRQSQRDTTVASVVSLLLVLLIFVYSYRETGRPLKATLCLVIGLAYTMAFATAVIGHLNILTITFVPMLVGLAIDFGVHLVTRYEEELRHGHTEREALEKAMVPTGQGIFTGCFTTAGAFFAMGVTDFRGIKEMGVICGGGLLVCLVPMMTLLPVLLLRGRQNVLDHSYHESLQRRVRMERLWLDRPALVIGLTVALCVWAGAYVGRVSFDYNLLHLQSKGLPAVEFARKLIHSTDKSVLYCAVVTDSLPEALALEQKVKTLPSVASADSMSLFLTEDQTRKLSLVGDIKRDLAALRFPEPDLGPVDLHALSQTLLFLQSYLALGAEETAQNNKEALTAQLRSLRAALGTLRQTMLTTDEEQAAARLAQFQQALFGDLRETFGALQRQDDSGPMRIEDLPLALRHRFVSSSGQYHMVQVYPQEDVWQRANQEEFIGELRRALDPQDTHKPIITGTPVQLLEYTTLLKNSYEEAAGYALVAIALLVFAHFRSLLCVILALLPVGVGTIWMMGLMGASDQPFNPANIMTLPLVIGIGVTSGIHVLNRFAEERTPSILAKSTGKAILVSGLTTVVGFGSLMIAKHQGIASLGYVMAVGTLTCMIAALTLLPALLRYLTEWGWSPGRKKPSDETAQSALGREEPR